MFAAEPWLRRKAEELLDAAADNMPIELEAERLLVAAEKKFKFFVSREDLKTYLTNPQWWEYVVAFHPPLQPYHAWVDDLRQELLSMLLEEEGPQAANSDDAQEEHE